MTLLNGRYEVRSEIGQGATATVYVAHDRVTGTDVAVKVLRDEIASASSVERFQREIEVLRELQHPNIVRLLDAGEWDGRLFYVMRLVQGESLRDRLDRVRDRQLPVDEVVQIGRAVCDALASAHAIGVVHRDVKPENILLDGSQCYLTDFGLARGLDVQVWRTLTTDGKWVGTPQYMSPEQAAAEHDVDGRSDLYSLGLVLYECLAGLPAFVGPNAKAIIAMRFVVQPPSLTAFGRRIPATVVAAIERAIAQSPVDRWPDAPSFARALAFAPDVAGHTEVSSSSPSTGSHGASVPPSKKESPGSWTPRTRRRMGIAVVGLGLATVAAWIARDGLRPAKGDDRSGSASLEVRLTAAEARDSAVVAPALAALATELGRWQGVRVTTGAADGRLADGMSDAVARPDTATPPPVPGVVVIALRRAAASPAVAVEVIDPDRRTRYAQASLDLRPRPGDDALSELATRALLGDVVPAEWARGAQETRNLLAARAYVDGRRALARWDVDRAVAHFRAALEADSVFPSARLWWTQGIRWTHGAPDATAERRARLASLAPQLHSPRERSLATALRQEGSGALDSAAASYAALLARDSLDVVAWLGLARVHAGDDVVVHEPNGLARQRRPVFRSSYAAAYRALDRAFEIAPQSRRAVRFNLLITLAPFEPGRIRVGRRAGEASIAYAALPAWQGDTLAFVPLDLAAFSATARASVPTSVGAALRADRERLLRSVREWTVVLPDDGSAWLAYAELIESSGAVTDDGTHPVSAWDAVSRAVRCRLTTEQRTRAATARVRLLLKQERYADARAIGDSLVRAMPPDFLDLTGELSSIALLIGDHERAAAWYRGAARERGDSWATRGEPLARGISRYFTYAARGSCGDSLNVLRVRLDTLVATFVEASAQRVFRDSVVAPLASLAVTCTGAESMLAYATLDRKVIALQQALARHDTATVRAGLRQMRALRAGAEAGNVTLDATVQEAWLQLAIGEARAAAEQLDAGLRALPLTGSLLLTEPRIAGALVQALRVRGDAAVAIGDSVGVRHIQAMLQQLSTSHAGASRTGR